MGRLSLVLADYDAEYIRNFEKYLLMNYPKRFEIISFTSTDSLLSFIAGSPQIDILLLNSRMYDKKIGTYNSETVLILKEDESDIVPPGCDTAGKYKHADSLISEMIRLYTLRNVKDCPVSGNKKTCIISVLSPAGGTGNSSIAAGCSMLCAGRGLKTFYINLEAIASTARFFSGDSKQNFSNVIYHLKGSGNLWLRLETAKCSDIKTGVHFFKPAENILEMDELDDQDIASLIKEFKSSGVYNVVFIDLPAGISRRNAGILVHSDIVVLVLVQSPAMQVKIEEFNKGLDLAEQKFKSDIKGKTIPVLNFSAKKETTDIVFGYKPAVVIPGRSIPHHDIFSDDPAAKVTFLANLNKVIDYVSSDKPVTGIFTGGGESIA